MDILGLDVTWAAGVRRGRLDPAVDRRATQPGRAGHPGRRRWRPPPGRAAVRRPVQHQHPAAVVPQGPGAHAAHDLGRDDRPWPSALARQGKPHYVEIQGAQYEGLTVWFNTLVARPAGGSIVNGDGHAPVARAAGRRRRLTICTTWPPRPRPTRRCPTRWRTRTGWPWSPARPPSSSTTRSSTRR